MTLHGFKTWCPGCFKALSTKVRSGIVDLIQRKGELAVSQIVDKFKLKQPTISYHLSQLEKSGLLESRAEGRHVFYRLNQKCPYDNRKCILR